MPFLYGRLSRNFFQKEKSEQYIRDYVSIYRKEDFQMTVDQYTLGITVDQCVEISKDGKIVFKGTIRELQEHFYTLGQCEVNEEPYQLANTHYIKIK